MRKITFTHQKGWGEHNTYKETFEYEDGTPDKQIEEDYEMWVWEQIGDDFSWHEEEEE